MSSERTSVTVTGALTKRNDQILLCRRALNQKLPLFWEFPGGKVEEGETYAACLERELLEELGVQTRVGAVVAENVHHYDDFSIRLVLLETEILSGEITLSVHDKFEWVPVESLLSMKLAPADIPLAEKVVAMFSGSCE